MLYSLRCMLACFLPPSRTPDVSFLPCLYLSLWCINCRHPQGVISSLPQLWPFRISSSLTVTHTQADTHTHTPLHLVSSPDVGSLQMVMGTDKSHSVQGRQRVLKCVCVGACTWYQEGDWEKRMWNWLKTQMFPWHRSGVLSFHNLSLLPL